MKEKGWNRFLFYISILKRLYIKIILKKQIMKTNKHLINSVVIAITVSLITSLFFYLGKLFDFIPYGTHKGGLISAAGVGIIALVCFTVIYCWYRYQKKKIN